ncbi:MAG: PD40 domain-containing protein [Anaerolineae bacterium]|nr:PD40 domain-containing protein [Anaerolineae bacterium]
MIARWVTRFSALLTAAGTLAALAAVGVGTALPRGDELLYSSVTSWRSGWVYIYTLDVGRGLTQRMFTSRTDNLPGEPVIWSPDGEQIAYIIDDKRLETHLANANGIHNRRLGEDHTDFEYNTIWSPDGQQLAFIGGNASAGDIYVAAADGSASRNVTGTGAGYSNLAWSPDGRYLAAESLGDIILVDVADGTVRNLTAHPTRDLRPAWSADGRYIAFMSSRQSGGMGGTRFDLYLQDTDCIHSGESCADSLRRLTDEHPADSSWQINWSPVGTRLLFASISWMGGSDVYWADADSGAVRNLTHDTARDSSPEWSPDGSHFAFESSVSGEWALYVLDGDGNNRRRITPRGHESRRPVFSPDGAQVLFLSNLARNWDLYLVGLNGGTPRRLTNSYRIDFYPIWRP